MRQTSRKRNQIWLAWSAVVLCIAVIGLFSTDAFSSDETSHFFRDLLLWLSPDIHWRTARAINLLARKAAHFIEYAVLALLACRAIWISFETSLGRIAALALVLVLFVATADETHQAFAPTRGGSPWDVALDVSGGLAAIAVFLAFRRVSRRGDAAARPQG